MVEQPRLPSLAAIGAFEAAARLGSFAAAARELGTTSASVSYHIRQLERQTGVPLFRRFAHRVVLTEAGREIAGTTIQAFDALRGSFMRAAAIDEGRLVLSALPTFGTSWLIPRLGRFRAAHPEIAIELDLSPEPRDLAAGHVDAAIRNGHGQWPGLRTAPLLPSIFLPLCPPALAGVDLESAPLLGRPDWWTRWFAALGRPVPQHFGIALADEHLDAAAAIAGHGITIGSPILFRAELEAGRLVPAHDLVVGDGRSFWLAWPSGRQGSRKIQAFRAWIEVEAEAERAASSDFIARSILCGQ
ncbi:LysR family transcriptional regulator [Sphingomonas sp. R-74633]|uniref:LysR substrate-binding domain-containing protein n=1 Tax=Sphingomonas sp. R-74633 TaxID=2751188 RepID=UPI0015D282AA|nr:LysR substrate-binding domain-containing protein [Sphingomonas sp. R-74633]NYT42788.1 LysR family transcriptional regulator [Sphingomonas sp. R-74633]